MEVNCFLAESYYTSRKTDSMLNFQKSLDYQLIENTYLEQEERQQRHRFTQIQEGVGHGLVSLPTLRKLLDRCMVKSVSKYPPPPQYSQCHCKVQTYCRCTPGVYLCCNCFADHINDLDNHSQKLPIDSVFQA